jgi:RNA polymerase sigma factor (sigma-70 family)
VNESPPGLERAQTTSAFATTHWSVVLAARDSDSPAGAEALARLCEAYWYPLYVYVRRRGLGPEDAQDLTQEFFARLLEKNFLRLVDPGRGRFRSFLVMALDRFLAKEWQRQHRQKRGGGRPLSSLDAAEGEQRYFREPAREYPPEKLFDRRWALTLLERTLAQLGRECEAAGKGALFRAVQGWLAGESEGQPYEALARRLGLSVNALKVAVHRLRRRHARLLRAEVAQTVARPEEVDDEIRYLLGTLAD